MANSNPARGRRAAALLLLAAASCVYPRGDGRVFVTSEPPGAEILVDGRPSGRTTPAELDLGGPLAGDHELTILKAGFEAERRRVTAFKRFDVARLDDGVTDVIVPPLPLWFTIGDLLFPVTYAWRYVPHDLHVRLHPAGTFTRGPAGAAKGSGDG